MTYNSTPQEVAEYFSEIQNQYGLNFDFSIESLKTEIDKFINQNEGLSEYIQTIIEPLLTSYIGETLCRNFKGKWEGNFRNSFVITGSNYYDCWIEINNLKFWPSHFIEYRLSHGKSAGSFKAFILDKINDFGNNSTT